MFKQALLGLLLLSGSLSACTNESIDLNHSNNWSASSNLGAVQADVSLIPARAGFNTIDVRLSDSKGRPVENAAVNIDAQSGKRHGAIRLTAHPVYPGVYRAYGEFVQGPLNFDLSISLPNRDYERLAVTTEIPRAVASQNNVR
ncbi:MAG TPA: hypothetical protein V6D17_06810 [Candidatus Obscuribacterales bacterium]